MSDLYSKLERMSPKERRAWIESLHGKAHGKSQLGEQICAMQTVLGGRTDKDFVLKTMTEVLGIEPEEKDDGYRFGRWEVHFDQHDRLVGISLSSGTAIIGTKRRYVRYT